ncbi:nuclear transport factor 2 family protein [Yoonia sp.]|uniref:nuclear transport factor 2 family protein n=1 Tax=Yoonia sp. TaxID=2212373 RepID=UPI00391B9542
MTERDPYRNPFSASDNDRAAIWDMLVQRDIDAFVAADWDAVAGDFIADNFTGFSGHFQREPDGYTLAYPTLSAYRDDWIRQAQDFGAQKAAGAYAGDPRAGIFAATRLEEIEITGDAALVRKRFDGHLPRSDGSREKMNWQTLYWCRRLDGRWKIAGFLGYLPHVMDD